MGRTGKEDRCEAWNFSEIVVTCNAESRMDSHCTPSIDNVAAQRGLMRPSGKLELTLLSYLKALGTGSSFELCVSIMGLTKSLLSAPGCPAAGAASSLKVAECVLVLSDNSYA